MPDMPVSNRLACPTQWFERDGRCLTPPDTVPPYCAAVALTTLGRAVCNRGCGFFGALDDAPVGLPGEASGGFATFRCPFGVSNALALKGDAVILVGGRVFANYAQFRAFVNNAVEAGAAAETVLAGCDTLIFQNPEALRTVFERRRCQRFWHAVRKKRQKR